MYLATEAASRGITKGSAHVGGETTYEAAGTVMRSIWGHEMAKGEESEAGMAARPASDPSAHHFWHSSTSGLNPAPSPNMLNYIHTSSLQV